MTTKTKPEKYLFERIRKGMYFDDIIIIIIHHHMSEGGRGKSKNR
jgi:hypothetical protein